MTLYSDYYETVLYPVQNRILNILKKCDAPFYLTGGTALSRGYLNHRYSDDLDLFFTEKSSFQEWVERIIDFMEKEQFSVHVETVAPMFSRIFVDKGKNGLNKNGLKIDFVFDVVPHFGEFQETPVFYRTDSIRNILSNKVTALYRYSIKDIVDLCEISRNFSFSWKNVIEDAEKKEAGIDLGEIVEIFSSFPASVLEQINWIKKPDINEFQKMIERISYDMVNLESNSICREGKQIVEAKKKKPRNRDSWER